MKTPSRTLVISASAAALIMLAGLIIAQEVRRQSTVKSARFAEQYAGVIRQLCENVDSVHKKMKRNEMLIPALVAEAVPEIPASELIAVPAPDAVRQAVAKSPPIVLQGISWSVDNPLVMIDDRIYKPGDKIGEVVIQEIFPRAVIFRDAGGMLSEFNLIGEARP